MRRLVGYRWRPGPTLLGLLVFSLVSASGAGGIAAARGEVGTQCGYVTFVMVAMISLCMLTGRGNWPWWKRLLFVPVAWIAQVPLSLAACFVVLPLALLVGRPTLIDPAGSLVASIPLVVFAMRRSRLFVVDTDSGGPSL